MNDKKIERESKLTKQQQEWSDLLGRVEALINKANSLNSVDLRKQVAGLRKVLKTNEPSSKTYKSVLKTVNRLEAFYNRVYTVKDQSNVR